MNSHKSNLTKPIHRKMSARSTNMRRKLPNQNAKANYEYAKGYLIMCVVNSGVVLYIQILCHCKCEFIKPQQNSKTE